MLHRLPSKLTTKDLQAKNIVLNLSEIESKVREATNDDPWCVWGHALDLQSVLLTLLVFAGERARL